MREEGGDVFARGRVEVVREGAGELEEDFGGGEPVLFERGELGGFDGV